MVVVFNATFNNISAISWPSVLMVEETGETTNLSRATDKLYHIMLYRLHLTMSYDHDHDSPGLHVRENPGRLQRTDQ